MNKANPHLPYGPRVFEERFSLRDEKTGERVFVFNRWFLLYREFESVTYIQKPDGKRVHIPFSSPIEAEYYALRLMRGG
jgi:hypothetical protein